MSDEEINLPLSTSESRLSIEEKPLKSKTFDFLYRSRRANQNSASRFFVDFLAILLMMSPCS